MHPQFPGVIFMIIMGIFHTPPSPTPPEDCALVLSNMTATANINDPFGNYTWSESNMTQVERACWQNAKSATPPPPPTPVQLVGEYKQLYDTKDKAHKLSGESLNRRLVGRLRVGNQGEEFRFLLDATHSNKTVLLTPEVASKFAKLKPYETGKHTTSYELYGNYMRNHTGQYPVDNKDWKVKDIVGIPGDDRSFNQDFDVLLYVTEPMTTFFKETPADGILSLLPRSQAISRSFLNTTLSAANDTMVTVFVEPSSNLTSSSNRDRRAIITLGGRDPLHCNAAKWVEVRQTNASLWSFYLDHHIFNRETLEEDQPLVETVAPAAKGSSRLGSIYAPSLKTVRQIVGVDLSQTLSHIPEAELKYIAGTLKAVQSNQTSKFGEYLYSVPCVDDFLRDVCLVFTLEDDKKIKLRREDYLVPNPEKEGECFLIFVANNAIPGVKQYDWTLGALFFNNICVSLDTSQAEMAFTYTNRL